LFYVIFFKHLSHKNSRNQLHEQLQQSNQHSVANSTNESKLNFKLSNENSVSGGSSITVSRVLASSESQNSNLSENLSIVAQSRQVPDKFRYFSANSSSSNSFSNQAQSSNKYSSHHIQNQKDRSFKNDEQNILNDENDNIFIENASKLGILVQTKLLEDKVNK
jgi:hypothetical protein